MAEDALIAQGCTLEGSIAGNATLIVEGVVKGDISMAGDVLVRKSGEAYSNISGESVNVEGKVVGNVSASKFVYIAPNAYVKGDISGPSVSIEKGARFSGRLCVGDGGGEADDDGDGDQA